MESLRRLELGFEANFIYFTELCFPQTKKSEDRNNNLKNLSSTDNLHTGLFLVPHSLPLTSRLPHLSLLALQMLGEIQKRSHFTDNP